MKASVVSGLAIIVVVAAFGCGSPPATGTLIGENVNRTSVTFCNYYIGVCTDTAQVTEEVKLADGSSAMITYPVCVTPGVAALCDEKYGCPVCFDPVVAAQNNLNLSQICAVGCRDFFFDMKSGADVGTDGTFDCRWNSRPNASLATHNPLVQANKCEAGLPSVPVDIPPPANSALVAKIPLGVTMDSQVTVQAQPAFFNPINLSGPVLDGRISLTRQGCSDGHCLYDLNVFSVNLPPFTFPLLDGQSSGEEIIPLINVTNIELKTRDRVRIDADSAGNFTIPANSTFFVGRFDVNGTPKVRGIKLATPITGKINPAQSQFRLTGQVGFSVPGVGLDQTAVPVSVTYDIGGKYIDSDNDGIPDANDSCPLDPSTGSELKKLKFTALPPDVTVSACTTPTIPKPTATGNCWVNYNNDMPAHLPLGTTVVTWTVRDAAGQVIRTTQKVTAVLGDDSSCCPAGTNVIRGTANNDHLTGTAGADCILGLGGQDVIFGGGGNDFISGGEGDDELHGENGNDVIDGGGGQDRLFGDAGDDTLSGGNGDDRLNGGIGADVLNGGDAQDQLFGDAGNDKLFGNAGDDTLNGGDGSDTCNGGGLHDTLQLCEVVQ